MRRSMSVDLETMAPTGYDASPGFVVGCRGAAYCPAQKAHQLRSLEKADGRDQ